MMVIPKPHYEFSLTLMKNKEYDVALDQSTSCTGIAIFSTDNDVKILLEVARDTGEKETFYRDLKHILGAIVKDNKIRLVICEDPPYVKNKMYSSRMLLELRGRIQEWMYDIPEFTEAEFCSIFPQSWKTFVVDKSKGTGRSNKKACIAEDICDVYPIFLSYFGQRYNKDLDGFDAVGILIGYRKYAFTDDGVRLICGTQEKRHTSLVFYRYIPAEWIKDKNKLNEEFKELYVFIKPKFRMYNTRYNKHENIRMASTNCVKNNCIFTFLGDNEFDVLKWKYDLEKKDDHILLMYVMNKSHADAGVINLITSMFPMNEEVSAL